MGRALVEDQPIQAQLPNRFHELAEINRLPNVAVGAEAMQQEDRLALPAVFDPEVQRGIPRSDIDQAIDCPRACGRGQRRRW